MTRFTQIILSTCICCIIVTWAVLTSQNTSQAAALPGSLTPNVPNPQIVFGHHIQVGPTRTFTVPSQAAAIAQDGDFIDIDSGLYSGDVAIWPQNGITITGIAPAGQTATAHLAAAGQNAGGKAIWVIQGNNVTVNNIEFSGTTVPDGNGAGIRAEGINLAIFNCYFHHNQEGILSSVSTPTSIIDIENSRFFHNGGNGGYSHELYINNIQKLIVRGSVFLYGQQGHLVKSRAQMSLIVGNRITDMTGSSSYEIDFPNGGFNVVVGNIIEKGPAAQNPILVTTGEEGVTNTDNEMYIINNTFQNDIGGGYFIVSYTPATVTNNIFVGAGQVIYGNGTVTNNMFVSGVNGAPNVHRSLFGPADIVEQGNITVADAKFINQANFNFGLLPTSPAIGLAVDPGSIKGVSLEQTIEFHWPNSAYPVRWKLPFDMGGHQH